MNKSQIGESRRNLETWLHEDVDFALEIVCSREEITDLYRSIAENERKDDEACAF